MNIEVVLRSHLSTGMVTIDGLPQPLLAKNYHHKFASQDSEKIIIASFWDLPPGIKDGIEIVSFKADGRELLDIKHLKLEDFCVLHMKNNPYVSNETIAERNIVFNGDLVCSINPDKVLWFPYHFSDEPTGFVYVNHHTACENDDGCYHGEDKEHLDVWSNLPFPVIDLSKSNKVAVGCSVTYGTGVSKSRVWPALLGLENFGVQGAGVDAIYHNLAFLAEKRTVDLAVLLLPNLERRLMTFEQNGYHFRVPVLAYQDQLLAKNYYWASKDELTNLQAECLRHIINDEENDHSRGYLEKISRLPFKILVSSWSKETYSILPKYFDHVLPFFECLDDANDTPPHPGPLSHRKWAEKVQDFL